MISIEALCRMVQGVDEAELMRWVEQQWIIPKGAPGAYLFEEIDVARVRLICEMRQELAVGDEALPTLLSLLDQVYALRDQLRTVYAAIAAQPDEIRQAIIASLPRGA